MILSRSKFWSRSCPDLGFGPELGFGLVLTFGPEAEVVFNRS